jgi:glycosyltransferase involved in cell wall biosynthesis
MSIMVFDVPAESGGALSVLNDFYEEIKSDKSKNWIIVVSKPELSETHNVKVLRYPWVKKSWFHRLYFDNFVSPRLIREYDVDEVISLQNMIIPRTKINQTVYVHNCLPFTEYRFSIAENRLLWVYQNIISKIIFKSIKKARKVIVQTEWMKKVCLQKLGVNGTKIEVMPPKINLEVKKYFIPTKESLTTFFYPATGMNFKNHKIILKAAKKIKDLSMDFCIYFTIYGNENDYIRKIHKQVLEQELPIKFLGQVSRDDVFDFYSKSVLLFPSKVESFGLPLLEARMHKCIIFASNTSFSREVLSEYEKANFFDPEDDNELFNLMYNIIKDN